MNNAQKIIYGLIGYPVKHSFSKVMQEAAFKACGINAEYRLFEIKPEELEDFLLENIQIKDINGDNFYSQDIKGFNITIPHKIRVKEILETKFPLDQQAKLPNKESFFVRLSGAVNTVARENNIYYNTDVPGFLRSLKEDLSFILQGKNVLVIGCGGAGRAAIAGLSWDDTENRQVSKVYIADINNQTIESAKKHFLQFSDIEKKLEFITTENIPEVIKKCDLLVNVSPIGMKDGDPSIIDKKLLHSNLSVYDVVYNRETQLIKEAHQLGIPAVGGLGMLLYQGMLSFQIWTGKPAPEEVMREALNKVLAKV